MSSIQKISIALALVLVGAGVAIKASQTKGLSAKFKVNPLMPNNIGISSGLLNINFPVQIINQSTFEVKLTNLYVTVSYIDSMGNLQDLFFQTNAIREVTFAPGVATNLNNIPLSMQITNGLNLLDILRGKLSRNLQVSVRFQVAGVEVDPIVTQIDANTYLAPVQAFMKKIGLAGLPVNHFSELPNYQPNDLGYSGFHTRKIKDASKYADLIDPSSNTTSVVRQNGSAYDTIDDMAKIVSETLGQTKRLAEALKGNSTEETVRNIYTWLHDHIQYNRDKEGEEQLREPARSFADRNSGIDCDCFSIFASSLLTNAGIPHYIEMCQIKPDPWFKHVYVVVPKKPNASLSQRDNYWVVDACLHQFDELAPNITLKYNRPMYTTRLAGLDAAGKCNCPSKPVGSFGVQKVSVSSIPNSATANQLELQILEPMRQNLIAAKNDALKNPGSVSLMYHPGKLVQSIDYALANWNDPVNRHKALDVLASQEEAIVNRPVLNGLMGAGAFRGLDGFDYDPTLSHPMLGVDDDGNLTIDGLGGIFSSAKKAVQSVKTTVKKIQTKAADTVKAGVKKVGNAAKVTKAVLDKAATAVKTGVVNAAKFVASNVQKINPAMVLSRTAFRGLVALNFRGMASDMSRIISTAAGEKKIKDFWTSNLIGGNWGDLIAAINTGKNKKHLLGDLGEPVTVAASVASATPILVKIADIIKSALKSAPKIAKAVETVKTVQSKVNNAKQAVQNVQSTVQNVQSMLPGSNPSPGLLPVTNNVDPFTPTYPSSAEAPQSIDPETGIQIQDVNPAIAVQKQEVQTADVATGSGSKTGLYVAGAAIVAAILYAISSGNDNNKNLSGVPAITI